MDVTVVELQELIGHDGSAPLRAAGVEHVELLAPPGSYTRQKPVLVLGELEPHAEIYREFVRTETQQKPAVRLVTLRNASVLNQGAVITSDGRVIKESCVAFLRDRVPMFGIEQHDDGRLRQTAPSVRHIEAPTLLVKGAWWRNYGHWLIDESAMLSLVFRRSSLPRETKILVGAYEDPHMRALVEETVESINPRYELLEHPDEECWTFSRLYYVTPIHIPPLFKSPDALSDLRDLLVPPRHSGKLEGRFYVQRPDRGRAIVNEPEIIELCRSYGFQLVRPEVLSLREQLTLFQRAEVLVGVKGAAFANLIFSSPGASAILLSSADFSDAFYWDIAAQAKVSYMEVFGPLASRDGITAQNPFTIDVKHLDHALRIACPNHPAAASIASVPLARTGIRTSAIQSSSVREMPMPTVDSLPALTGTHYLNVLRLFVQELRPLSYLEIGTNAGDSLRLVGCRAIAVDAKFELQGDVVGTKPACHLFQMPSDQFFDHHDPTAILGRRIDAAFVDGLHLCEYVLRDFANVERHCRQNSIIFMHDCVPLEFLICGRVHGQDSVDPERRGWWQGDVWRAILALKRRRPDLRITVLDAQPTGLACITNLNPASDVLFANYSDIVDEMHSWKLEDIGLQEYQSMVHVEPTSIVDTPEKMARRFWL